MIQKFIKLLVYITLVSHIKAQFGPFTQFGNFPILSQLLTVACGAGGRPNEVYSPCGNNACQNTCRNPTATAGCSGACVAGCVCAIGYIRNSANICVLPQNCDVNPGCTGVNEVYSVCGNNGCQPTCTNPNVAATCNPICSTPTCVCAAGFVRNNLGVCVSLSSCIPTNICIRVNEIYSTCGDDGCQMTCTRLDVTSCVRICSNPGCICVAGYVRSGAGICVSPQTCPITTTVCSKPNEIFSTCGNDGCQRSCIRLNVIGCASVCSTPGCICATGFVRDSAGNCILQNECSSGGCTRANEILSQCGNDGCQRSCSRLDISSCNPVCSTPSCVCSTGFVRDILGNCILPSACSNPTCTGANEILSICGNDGCQRSCTRLDVTGCSQFCNTPACICATGFVRNSASDCVLPTSCPAVTCARTNEVFSACGIDDCQKTCSRLETTGCTRVCTQSGCICNIGYVRNSAGDCVSPSTCPAITCNAAANEIFSACGNDGCQRSCTRQDTTGCSPVCIASGCICSPGFVKNSAGACVSPSTCPPITCTGNEIFSACGNDGCQRTCGRLDTTGCTPVCTMSGCICAPGFVRNSQGQCVAPTACPATTCNGPNEVFSACGEDGCQKSCTRLDTTGCTKVCTASGCVCTPGNVRNSAGACVSPTTCPSVTCGLNEMFSSCGNDGCQSSCIKRDVTGCTSVCIASGCICASGFVRNSQGICALPLTCPTATCGTNEMFSLCGNDGCQRTCSRLDVTGCTRQCTVSGCICMSGYVRSASGVCVLPTSCPAVSCPGTNEMFSACGNDGCQRSCTRRDVTGCNPVCQASGCICSPGFVRNAQGACVTIDTCPSITCPGNNEMVSACGEDGCQRRCDRLDVTGCNRVCTTYGCICMAGFVRNAAGNCVSPQSCPTITCSGANEILSPCGNDGCQKTCLRLDVTGCSTTCATAACVCSPGFVRNSAGTCVLPMTCPQVSCTGANEVFSACGNDGCQRTCARLVTTGCTSVCTASACVCATGYVRNSLGVCVLPSACPPVVCFAPNEIFSQCGNNGCQKTCARLDVTGCVPVCTVSGCICDSGYVRNSAGVCILESTCPPISCTASNEVYSACGEDGCQRTCSRLDVTGCNRVCIASGCVCKPGFVRNGVGSCVSPTMCPGMTCSGNQVFSQCGDDGCQRSCRRLETTGCTSVCRASGCICASGYVRDDLGACILPGNCPATTPPCPDINEVFSTCGDDGCQKTCTRRDTSGCTKICTMSGCICKPGYLRNAMGMCVTLTSCPTITCGGTNEMLSACGDDGCLPSCAKRDTTGCVPVCRVSGCVCQPGFYRDAAGTCVASCTTPTCGTNEIFSNCGEHNCIETCTFVPTQPCTKVCAPSGCVCNIGYYRNPAGTCVNTIMCIPSCSTNQVYSRCGDDRCRPTCANQSPSTANCPCGTPACICQSGFVLNTNTGACLLRNTC